MKKLFTVLLVFVAFTSISLPQMQIGPKAGLNIASIGGDDADQLLEGQSLDSKTGFAGGLFFMYQFSNMFAIQPEAYYTMKGATYSESGADLTISLDYIEIPLLLKFLIPVEGSNIRPSIFAGPAVGFNMTAKSKVEYEGESQENDFKDETASTEFSLAFGGGLGFMVGKNELGVDVRYILGLSTFDDSSDPWDLKNNVINVNAYFGFSLQ
ncbi:MAG: PorT family protein [Ignavibacteriaceae bacterium]|nr:PorT family protein [Ignavibacteriaceae bacterium]